MSSFDPSMLSPERRAAVERQLEEMLPRFLRPVGEMDARAQYVHKWRMDRFGEWRAMPRDTRPSFEAYVKERKEWYLLAGVGGPYAPEQSGQLDE